MRDTYHEGLDSLSERLVEMTRLARHAVARATTALLDSDLDAAQEVISGDEEINRLDQVILDAIKQRTAISQAIGKIRTSAGGTKLVHTREVAIINQFREELGPEGPELAQILLRMGRGRLG